MIDIFRIISFFGIIILPASFGASERRKTLKRNARKRARDAKALQKVAQHLKPTCPPLGQGLQREAEAALAKAEALELQGRLEGLTVWERRRSKQSRKGSKALSDLWADLKAGQPGLGPGGKISW